MILGGHFDLEGKRKKIAELDTFTKKENFWSDIEQANKINKELAWNKKNSRKSRTFNKRIRRKYRIM